jgi:hypothetical protein
MRIAYDNFIDDLTSTTLTCLSENVNYPLINVQDQRLSMEWHSLTPTVQTITLDLGSPMSISTAALLSHNFTTSVSVTISANTTSSFASPATSKTIIYNSGIMLNFFTPVSYQYWQFTIDDPTNSLGYISLGRLWLGDYIDIDPSSEVDFTVTKKRSDRVIHGRGQQKFASIGTDWREFKLSFPNTNYTMVDKIATMYDVIGNHSSVIYCNFDTIRGLSNLIEPCYCTLMGNNIQFKHAEGRKFNYDLTLQEEK